MAMKNKTKTTNPPVVLEAHGVLSMKRINMYIDHDRSVGVCFSNSPTPAYFAGRSRFSSGLCRYA